MTITETRMEAIATRVLGGARCHLGEGAAYDSATDTAWWFDILERQLHEVHLGTGRKDVHTLPFMASALAMIDDGRQMILSEHGLYIRNTSGGRLYPYISLEADRPDLRSNDARVHPSGTFWVSTMGKAAEPGAGAIWAVYGGAVTRLFHGITIPNAICFSPDGTTGYFADTYTNRLYRVPLDRRTGLPVGEPAILHEDLGVGGLDGAVTDRDGLIWCARWGGGCVDVYAPEGTHLRSIDIPALLASCPVFVGADFRQLLVTSAYQNLTEEERSSDPHHGLTFVLDVGAAGKPEPRVRLGAAS